MQPIECKGKKNNTTFYFQLKKAPQGYEKAVSPVKWFQVFPTLKQLRISLVWQNIRSSYFAKPPGPYTQLPQNKNFKTILQGLS